MGLQLAEKAQLPYITAYRCSQSLYSQFSHYLKIVLQNVDIDVIKAIIDSIHDKNELISLIKEDALNAIKICCKNLTSKHLRNIFCCICIKIKKRFYLLHHNQYSTSYYNIVLDFLSYNVTAFDKPEYFGTLRAAPWLIDIWNKGISQINVLREQLKSMSEGISMVFSRMDSVASTEESMVRVLHVSDIHNNPAAFDFMEQIVQNFQCRFCY